MAIASERVSIKAVEAIQHITAVGITNEHDLVYRIISQSEGVVRQIAISHPNHQGRRTTYHRCPACENGRLCYHLYVAAALLIWSKRPDHPFVQAYKSWRKGNYTTKRVATFLELAIGSELNKWTHIHAEPNIGRLQYDLTPVIADRIGDWVLNRRPQVFNLPPQVPVVNIPADLLALSMAS